MNDCNGSEAAFIYIEHKLNNTVCHRIATRPIANITAS